MRRGVVLGRAQGRAANAVEVGGFHRVVDDAAQSRGGRIRRSDAGDLVDAGGRGDVRRDVLVLGGNDLRAVPPVDLVAVVRRRVVAGRDHHPGRRSDVNRGERAQRRGDGIREEMSGDPEAGQDRGRVLGELAARVAAVEADDDAARGAGPGRRLAARARRCVPRPCAALMTTTRFMRASPPSTRPRKPGGAELERGREAVAELGRADASPGLGAGHERPQLVTGLGVGVLVGERAGLVEDVAHGLRPFYGRGPGKKKTPDASRHRAFVRPGERI